MSQEEQLQICFYICDAEKTMARTCVTLLKENKELGLQYIAYLQNTPDIILLIQECIDNDDAELLSLFIAHEVAQVNTLLNNQITIYEYAFLEKKIKCAALFKEYGISPLAMCFFLAKKSYHQHAEDLTYFFNDVIRFINIWHELFSLESCEEHIKTNQLIHIFLKILSMICTIH